MPGSDNRVTLTGFSRVGVPGLHLLFRQIICFLRNRPAAAVSFRVITAPTVYY